jgi:asparagine synthetase B (glutamine-hydrolysing)
VRIRLISEVPLGAHLSGGIDSSVVTALMARHSSEPVRTFSIGFHERAYDERAHARKVSEMYGTRHEEFVLEPDPAAMIDDLADHFGEPFADPAAIPTWHLARMTRRHVTVALNGDGGDEAFAGYQRHAIDPLADLLGRFPAFLRAGPCPICWRGCSRAAPTCRPSAMSPRRCGVWLRRPRSRGARASCVGAAISRRRRRRGCTVRTSRRSCARMRPRRGCARCGRARRRGIRWTGRWPPTSPPICRARCCRRWTA